MLVDVPNNLRTIDVVARVVAHYAESAILIRPPHLSLTTKTAGAVQYDKVSNTLVLTNVPENLKKLLLEE